MRLLLPKVNQTCTWNWPALLICSLLRGMETLVMHHDASEHFLRDSCTKTWFKVSSNQKLVRNFVLYFCSEKCSICKSNNFWRENSKIRIIVEFEFLMVFSNGQLLSDFYAETPVCIEVGVPISLCYANVCDKELASSEFRFLSLPLIILSQFKST